MVPCNTILPVYDYLDLLSILLYDNKLKMRKMLFDKFVAWLQMTVFTISYTQKNVTKLDDQIVENVYLLLNNTLIMCGDKPQYLDTVSSNEDDIFHANEYMEDIANEDDDETTLEESDDENLVTKMCTYLITQKDFMNQHWYYCYTCNMFDGIGVCTVCAKICHKNHDVSYAKYGNFFCDCGAKEDGTCIALTKKWNTPISTFNGRVSESIKRKDINDDSVDWKMNCAEKNLINENLAHNVDLPKQQMIRLLATLTYLLNELETKLVDSCLLSSSLKCYFRVKQSLKELHSLEKSYNFSENLIVPALGSQVS